MLLVKLTRSLTACKRHATFLKSLPGLCGVITLNQVTECVTFGAINLWWAWTVLVS